MQNIEGGKGQNAQFEHIALLKEGFKREGLPVLSMDSKKKEMLDDFYRNGRLYGQGAQKVNDHDFNSFSKGTVIPHDIYDVDNDKCYLTIGRTKHTAESVCDNIEHHWNSSIKPLCPSAERILVLGQQQLSTLCCERTDTETVGARIGMDITVAHYPAHCSKWNPIAHRAFCHITWASQGAVFDSYEIVGELAGDASTKSGFSVEVHMNEKVYLTGRKAMEGLRDNMPVAFDDFLPKWNYTLRHNAQTVIRACLNRILNHSPILLRII